MIIELRVGFEEGHETLVLTNASERNSYHLHRTLFNSLVKSVIRSKFVEESFDICILTDFISLSWLILIIDLLQPYYCNFKLDFFDFVDIKGLLLVFWPIFLLSIWQMQLANNFNQQIMAVLHKLFNNNVFISLILCYKCLVSPS